MFVKKIICVVMALFWTVQPLSVLALADEAGLVAVNSGSLNVRSRASTEGTVVSSLAKGSHITLVDKTGNWWQVEYSNGKYGYCSSDYIKTISHTDAVVSTQWGVLNVRSGPGAGYAKTDILSKGTKVMVLSSANGWSRILYHGSKTGYVSSTNLTAAAAYPSISLAVPSYKQTDSRWSWVKIGNSGKTIGQIGCATTGVAMMESYRTGKTIYPDAMSRQLSYSANGNLYWPSHYTAVTQTSGYLGVVYSILRQGKPVLFGAKNASGGQHWVVITGYNGGNSLTASGFSIHDPGSNSRTNLQQLLNSYPNFYKFFYY